MRFSWVHHSAVCGGRDVDFRIVLVELRSFGLGVEYHANHSPGYVLCKGIYPFIRVLLGTWHCIVRWEPMQ